MKSKSSKTKSSLSIDVNKESYFIFHCGIKVYPIAKGKNWFIQVDNNGKIKTFEKAITQSEVNDAIAKTIKFYYQQIKSKENENRNNSSK